MDLLSRKRPSNQFATNNQSMRIAHIKIFSALLWTSRLGVRSSNEMDRLDDGRRCTLFFSFNFPHSQKSLKSWSSGGVESSKGHFSSTFFWICKSPNGHSCLWVEWTAFASVKVTYHLTYLVVVIGRFDGSVSLKAMSQGSTFSISASIFSSSASLIATTTCLKQCSFSLQAAADILQLQFFIFSWLSWYSPTTSAIHLLPPGWKHEQSLVISWIRFALVASGSDIHFLKRHISTSYTTLHFTYLKEKLMDHLNEVNKFRCHTTAYNFGWYRSSTPSTNVSSWKAGRSTYLPTF